MKKILLLLLICFSPLSPLVTIIHGTFAPGTKWAMPGGDFYEAVKKDAENRGHKTISYNWSGENSLEGRIRAAHGLAALLLSYPSPTDHIVIGHSHGGNVIALASEFMSAAFSSPRSSKQTMRSIARRLSFFKTPGYRGKMFAFAPCLHLVKEAVTDLKTKIHTNRSASIQETSLIATAFFLGTPISEYCYRPNMNMIKKIISLYSAGDRVQTLVGKRTFEPQENIINLRVTLNQRNPTHEEMHAATIGSLLFSLDENESLCDGIVAFNDGQAPLFAPTLTKRLGRPSYPLADCSLLNQYRPMNKQGLDDVLQTHQVPCNMIKNHTNQINEDY